MSDTITISRKRYEELLRKEARLEEAEERADTAEVRAEAEFIDAVASEREQKSFWARAWCETLFWLQGAWEMVHKLTAKITHEEKLLSNPQLEPEERLVLQAYEELTVAPKHRDREGRALVLRKDVMKRTGLSESTCYRVDKRLEAAGHLDANVRYNPIKNKKDRFVKLAPAVKAAPETLSTAAPKVEKEWPTCHGCESDDTIVSRKTVLTVSCCECGEMRTSILPERPQRNPLYHTSEQDPANPGIMLPVNLKGSIKPGAKASEGSSA